jgi:hypothetical protein
MTDETQTNEETERQVLKARASVLGIQHSNNIGVEALKKKIEDKMAENEANSEASNTAPISTENVTQPQTVAPELNPLADEDEGPDFETMTPGQRKQYMRQTVVKKAMALVRVRIYCMDPKKKDIPGEIITTGNKFVGTVRKFIPFGEATDNGYHIPQMLLNVLRDRKFLQISTRKDKRTGRMTTTTRYVSEFAIEELEPLSKDDLAQLATEQAASGRVPDEDMGAL